MAEAVPAGLGTGSQGTRKPGSQGASPRLTETLVIVNPIAGAGRGRKVWAQLESGLRARLTLETRFTTGPGDAEAWAGEWGAQHPAGIVVVVGGDGSVHEVVNGLLDARASGRLAIIPAGSGNDFARNVRLSPNPLDAAGRLDPPDRVLRVDAARCTFRSPAGPTQARCFVNSLSVGISARANGIAVALRPALRSARRYPLAGALALLTQGSSPYQVRTDTRVVFAGPALNLTVANGARFGGGLRIAPDANPADGELDLVVIGAMSRLRALQALTRLRAGSHIRLPGVTTARIAERIQIVGPPGPLGIELDGENLEADGAITIEVLPGALAIVGAVDPG